MTEQNFVDGLGVWYEPIPFTSCIIWTGAYYKDTGYGHVMIGDRTKRAHRVAYELFVGPIPDGLCVLHKCDNTSCINPDHLFAGSKADNTRDMIVKGRAAYGERHGQHRLTEDQVRDIRRRYVPRVVTLAMLGREYGVTESMIGQIIQRKWWKGVAPCTE